MRLVIVESPAKAKTINKYLGKDYKVMASYGHIRDLLSKDGSVNPEKDFAMTWEMSTRGSHCVNDIISSIKSCDELLLATDPDREGEAISWHIKQVLEEKKCLNVPLKRIAFHEITKTAIQDAIKHPRDIDSFLVDAYLARRALDYLVGFTLSPILWRKLPGSKSAGRVQSVALRIIVDREEEIEAFKKEEYWTIEAKFTAPNKKKFDAHLTHHNNKKLNKFSIQNEEQAKAIVADLNGDFSVINAESKIVKRNPSPAFITSTLQQEASRKLGFSAKKTMQLAQRLYEGIDIGGETKALITYMRTDSINLSQDAIHKIRDVVSETYGKEFIPSKPRVYNTKVKNAQEAHEAIRPVDAGIIPDSLSGKMEADLLKLYSLIWKRAVASQMSSAEFNQVQVDLGDQKGNIFRANGNTITFEGFLKVYVEGNDDQDSEEMGLLPPLKVGDA
ncbi:MAG: type I DNA topoisomerase, partial [Alphaproteobacteria bacterium]|nr:type I DNA topoisomerase [Alphaproteobacteria bacterium]